MTINEAAAKLEAEHKNKRWFNIIGVAAPDTIYLYVHSLKMTPVKVKELKEYKGYRLVVYKMGYAKPA